MSASAAAAGGKRQRITVATDGGKSDCKAIANYRCATSSLYNIKAVPLIISLSGLSLVKVRSDITQTLKGLLSNPHDYSASKQVQILRRH